MTTSAPEKQPPGASMVDATGEVTAATAPAPDVTLVLSRLDAQVFQGETTETVRRTLARNALWRRLDVDRKRRWAHLAQAAGEMETALAVLEAVNAESPALVDPWQDRLELLALLDRREEMARAAAASRVHIGEDAYRQWMARSRAEAAPPDELVSGPFAQLRWREAAVDHFMALFSGREDCFARQWAHREDGRQGYAPVRRAMAYEDVEEHLAGRKTYGIYLMRADATVSCAVIDADLKAEFRHRRLTGEEGRRVKKEGAYLVGRLRELSREAGFDPLLEISGGKGFHLWYFFDRPVAAGTVRRALEPLARALAPDLSVFSLEVFPKQDRLTGKGLGNLVKLPLGIHRLTGKRSYFPECHDRSPDAQLRFLKDRQPVDAAVFDRAPPETGAQLVVHPRWQQWAESFPELFRLHQCCPPLGHLIAACREQKGQLRLREEKVLYQTIGFLPRARRLLHHLLESDPEYNPHQIDYRLSRLRGTPLGCRRIHQLLHYEGEFCRLEGGAGYAHPLLHLPDSDRGLDARGRPEKVENLQAALDNLQTAIDQVRRFVH